VPVFVVGDVHGHPERLAELLRDAGLIDGRGRWAGADARLWLLGDLVDRGPDGIGAIDLAMRLEREGGARCLLGNHEAFLIAACWHPFRQCGPWETFRSVWETNGGNPRDLDGLTPDRLDWLVRLPAVGRDGDWLIVHADTDRYVEYGGSIDSVNGAITKILLGSDTDTLASLLDAMCDRGALAKPKALRRLLSTFGGERVVHGHTPIALVRGVDPVGVTAPLVYAAGRVLNVDHGLYAGGPGFVTELR
jgi:hypothetical protein